jgi:hypothetical protein
MADKQDSVNYLADAHRAFVAPTGRRNFLMLLLYPVCSSSWRGKVPTMPEEITYWSSSGGNPVRFEISAAGLGTLTLSSNRASPDPLRAM